MNALTQRLSALLQRDLSEKCSSAAYAIMIDGQIIAEDSMGRNPIRGGTYNVGSISKVYCAVAPSANTSPASGCRTSGTKRSPSATA